MLVVVFPFGIGQVRGFKMDFFKKVFAESDPADEQRDDVKKGTDNQDDFPFVEGPEPDDDCSCICFCEEDKFGALVTQNLGNVTKAPEEEEEEDLVDPQDTLKEKCTERKDCQAYKEKLEECNARVESKSRTSETCVEELIDFMHCVDHCVSKTLFTKLK